MNENKININENEADSHRKKRETIKTLLIIFLIILLIFTFFSNTILNKSLPEVATEVCKSGSLTEKFRGSGIIEANQYYEVIVNENKKVDTVNIKSGKSVEKGDVLFVLSAEDSPELKEAEDLLATLELEYNTALLTVPNTYAAENLKIKIAKEDLQNLITRKQNAVTQADELKKSKERLADVTVKLNSDSSELTKYQEYIIAIDTEDFLSLSHEYSGDFIKLKNEIDSVETKKLELEEQLNVLKENNANPNEITDAETAYSTALTEYTTLLDSLSSKKSNTRQTFANKITELEKSVASLTAESSELENKIASYTELSPEEIETLITEKQRELEEIIISLDETKKTDMVEQQIESLNLNSKKEALDKQKELVEKLKEKSGTLEITSPYSGIISEVNIKAGETTLPETPLATIDISSEGYTLKISAEAEKTKKLKVGTEADIINNWSGDLSAVLTEIKNDTESKGKLLVFNVTGNVESGQNINLSIPCGTSKYDTIVPKNAVYEDSNGKFVLVLNSKNTPLGNRYYAERVTVEVLASDDVSSAVSGLINSGDHLIANSSKPIKPGDQVRTKD